MAILHGEETLYFEKPIVPGTKYTIDERMVDLQDKKKATVYYTES